MYDDFFSKAHELTQLGIPFATATVVRAEKPTSGKPGDKAIVTVEGVMHGWIGGSCAQPTVVREALKSLADDESRLIRLSTDAEGQTERDGLVDMPMTCFSGGTLEVYIEPHQPRPRILIIGTLPVAQALAHLGRAMNYHIIAADPDGQGTGMEHAHEIVTDLTKLRAHITPLTYVVVATHGNYDEFALEHILRMGVPYVGLVASSKRAASVIAYLENQGLSKAELLSLKAPAGLDIQARRGDEIALSIMAEIVQRRRNAEQLDWLFFKNQPNAVDATHEIDGESSESCGCCGGGSDLVEERSTVQTHAIDPICQMNVEISMAKYQSELEGIRYYFCCAGCKQTFDAKPALHLSR